MKKLFLLLAIVGFMAIACTPGGVLGDDNNANPTEQPGGNNGGEDQIPTDKIVIKPAKINVSSERDNFNYVVTVYSPCSWDATTEDDWINIRTILGGNGKQELTFSVKKNQTDVIREGKIVVANIDEGFSAELVVTQAKIGDIIENNGAKGVIFYIDETLIKLVSVTEGFALKWSTEYVATGATDRDNGANNMAIVKSISGWEDKYPAFKWCFDYGEGWYLPAYYEVGEIHNNPEKINATLKKGGYTVFSDKYLYWSSTEHDGGNAYGLVYYSGPNYYQEKDNIHRVRAISSIVNN